MMWVTLSIESSLTFKISRVLKSQIEFITARLFNFFCTIFICISPLFLFVRMKLLNGVNNRRLEYLQVYIFEKYKENIVNAAECVNVSPSVEHFFPLSPFFWNHFNSVNIINIILGNLVLVNEFWYKNIDSKREAVQWDIKVIHFFLYSFLSFSKHTFALSMKTEWR